MNQSKGFKCPECGKEFSLREYMIRHLRTFGCEKLKELKYKNPKKYIMLIENAYTKRKETAKKRAEESVLGKRKQIQEKSKKNLKSKRQKGEDDKQEEIDAPIICDPYEYEKLSDVKRHPNYDRLNTFGIILDASLPYYLKDLGKYLCTVKITDETLMNDEVNCQKRYVNVTIMSNSYDMSIPIISNIGDILRLHRCNCTTFEGDAQITCDTGIKGAWTIFYKAPPNKPTSSSSGLIYHSTITREDLDRARKLSKAFYDYYVIGKHMIIWEKPEPGEVDLICMIIKVSDDKDNPTMKQFTITDFINTYDIDVPITRFMDRMLFAIVRFRGLSLKKGKLILNDYSNILYLPKNAQNEQEAFAKAMEFIRKNKEIAASIPPYALEHTSEYLLTINPSFGQYLFH